MFFHINNHILREMYENKVYEKENKKPATYTYNPNTWVVNAGRLLWIPGQSELQSEFQDSLVYLEKLGLIYTMKINEYKVHFLPD